jgi:DNA-binding NarL/FixJ family response regulator
LTISTTKILLAEDFEPCRCLIASLLDKNPAFRIRCEASDGLEAVAKAQELGPDVVLMDIGLPKLNGLAAARRILDLIPSTKIIFLTQETDVDMVKEAFSLGAWGYVLKQEAEGDLLGALSAVLQGKRFLSNSARQMESCFCHQLN